MNIPSLEFINASHQFNNTESVSNDRQTCSNVASDEFIVPSKDFNGACGVTINAADEFIIPSGSFNDVKLKFYDAEYFLNPSDYFFKHPR